MPLANCGELNLEYYDEGSGPPLLMIMGFGGQAASWGEPIMSALRRSFRCIRVSNRGTGDSDPAPALRRGATMEPFTVRTMAGDALALLDALSIDRVHVFGVSMGGMIAQEIAINNPERVDRLVLGCTTPGGARAVAASPEVFEMIMPQPGLSREDQIRKAWPAITTQRMLDEKTFLEEMLEISLAKPTPMETILKQMAAVQAFDSYDRLERISTPTLIIHGDQDRLVPPENGRLLQERIPGSRLEIIPGAAHMFIWECPERTAALVTSFLATPAAK